MPTIFKSNFRKFLSLFIGRTRAKQDKENMDQYNEGIEDLKERCRLAVKKSGHGVSQNYR